MKKRSTKKGRIFIVSNRLPVSIEQSDGEISLQKSVGGLATGLSSFYKEKGGKWIGWPGINVQMEDKKMQNLVSQKLEEELCHPVFIPEDKFRGYYNGFSNSTLWPLCHYFWESSVFDSSYWNDYREVNELFKDEIVKIAKPDDYIWIQDYHLTLLPKMIRDEIPDINIGFFLHIPFPSSEVFRQLPWREEILEGMLGADLIGFHTYDYVRHFTSSVRRIIGHEHTLSKIKTDRNVVKVDVFPISIDYDKYAESYKNPDVLTEIEKFHDRSEGRKFIVTIDRLDYTKGIPQRLEAFYKFLELYPEYHEKVSLVMLSAPSRTDVKTYKDLKNKVDELVGNINGKYGKIGWTPVIYFYRSLPFESVAALYNIADMAMVTPLRDGMNLVAKEYVAARHDNKGAIVLSETAGAAQELSEAFIVNPNNKVEIAEAIKKALELSEKEQKNRMKVMQQRIKRYDINRWANDFMKEFREIKFEQDAYLSKNLTKKAAGKIISDYGKSGKRLLLLDYDGTLTWFRKRPEDAKPDNELHKIIKKLADNERNTLFIISGRDKKTLEKWFKGINLGIIAEHGVWIRNEEGEWNTLYPISDEWKKEIYPIFQTFADRTPGAFIEEKDYSLVWHYRNVDHNLAHIRVNELKEVVVNLTQNLSLGVMDGNKIIEIKNLNINKGAAADTVIKKNESDFILCIGDDLTDEDMFRVMPENAYSIRVGLHPSMAKFNIKSVRDVRNFLTNLEG